MRKQNKEIQDKETVISLLHTCHAGRLGTIGADGYPMIKPLNFAYYEDRIYFHSALEGEKIEDIRRDNRVCFEVDLPIALVLADTEPCRAEYLYQSIIIKGIAHIIGDRSEKLFGLACLMKKYQPQGGCGDFLEAKLDMTAVVRIDIEEMVGKEDLGKDNLRESVLRALKEKTPLPMTITRGGKQA